MGLSLVGVRGRGRGSTGGRVRGSLAGSFRGRGRDRFWFGSGTQLDLNSFRCHLGLKN